MKRTLILALLCLLLQACGGKTTAAPAPAPVSPQAVCGNGACESGEDPAICPADCAAPEQSPQSTATLLPSLTFTSTLTPTSTPIPGPFDLSANPYAGLSSPGRIGTLGRGAVWDLHYGADGTLAVLSASGIWTYDGRSLQTVSTPSQEGQLQPESEVPLVWSPDGSTLAGAQGHDVYLWNALTGEEVSTNITGFAYVINTLAWSPDGLQLAAGTVNGGIHVYRMDAGLKDPLELKAPDRIRSLAWSPDGRMLASGQDDHTITLWDSVSGAQMGALDLGGDTAWQLAWSPDGRYLALGLSSRDLWVWDVLSGESIVRLIDEFQVGGLAFSPDGRRLAVGSAHDLAVWDLGSGAQAATLKGGPGYPARILWSPDGGSLVSLQENGTLTAWDAAGGQQTGLTMGHLSAVDRLAWSPQGSPLASAIRDTGVLLWDTDSWQPKQTLWEDQITDLKDIAWSPDGAVLAGGFGSRTISAGTIRLVDLASGSETSMSGHEYWVTCLAWSPDGSTLASGSNDTRVILWDPAARQPLRTLNGHTGWVYDVAFSPDGKTLASAARMNSNGSSLDVILWEAATGRQVRRMSQKVPGQFTEATLLWSADGSTLTAYMNAGAGVAVFNAVTGQLQPTSRDLPSYSANTAYSPDNQLVAYGSDDGTITLDDNPYLPKAPTPTRTPSPSPTRDPKITPSATPTVGAGSVMFSTGDRRPMVFVPAGPFLMGASSEDVDADTDEKPQHTVTLDAFWIDQYEVTHDDYTVCVQAGACSAPAAEDTNGFSYDFAAAIEDAPVINVSWNQAAAYCTWAGKRLPSEAEWEKAARGTDARIYPWGNDPDAFRIAWYCFSCIYHPDFPDVRDDFSRPASVGSFPDGVSPYGAFDMAGNVWEWVLDWYASGTYSGPDLTNPSGPESGEMRVIRGGSWTNASTSLRTTYREARNPLSTWIDIGFRCVMPDNKK
jgi:WD40 repeat protein